MVTDSAPLRPLLPFQSPAAEQLVALDVDQVTLTLPPGATVEGVAEMEITGSGGKTSVTSAPAEVVPFELEHDRSKVVVDWILVTTCVPLVAVLLVQPLSAVQDVALVADQVTVVEPPGPTELGLAETLMVGNGGATIVRDTAFCTVPPGPVHVSE